MLVNLNGVIYQMMEMNLTGNSSYIILDLSLWKPI